MLFYLVRNGYHWSDEAGSQVHILQFSNDQSEADQRSLGVWRFFGERASILPAAFVQYRDQVWRARRAALPPVPP
eukprot:9267124-Lingulodinium_polyedra.AAC.1